jgi:hypothetical protein
MNFTPQIPDSGTEDNYHIVKSDGSTEEVKITRTATFNEAGSSIGTPLSAQNLNKIVEDIKSDGSVFKSQINNNNKALTQNELSDNSIFSSAITTSNKGLTSSQLTSPYSSTNKIVTQNDVPVIEHIPVETFLFHHEDTSTCTIMLTPEETGLSTNLLITLHEDPVYGEAYIITLIRGNILIKKGEYIKICSCGEKYNSNNLTMGHTGSEGFDIKIDASPQDYNKLVYCIDSFSMTGGADYAGSNDQDCNAMMRIDT